MAIRYLKQYLFFSVVAIKIMCFLVFTKELKAQILPSSVTLRLSLLIYNGIEVTASSDGKVTAKVFLILPSLSN